MADNEAVRDRPAEASSSTQDGHCNLTDQFKAASKSAHNISNALVMGKLAVACTDQKLYPRAVSSFYFIHKAIADAVKEHEKHPEVGQIAGICSRVDRTAAFEDDLRTLLGDSWLARVSPPPAAVRTYQERIAELSKSQPVLLVAHAYTQHMALLAGGQRTRQLVLGARPPTTGDAGTSLFVFEEDVVALKNDYREALNGLGAKLGEQETQQLLDEHVRVFNMNNAVLRALPVRVRHWPRAVFKLLPPELVISTFAVGFALFMVWIQPHFLHFAQRLEASLGYGSSPGGSDLSAAAPEVEGTPCHGELCNGEL